LAGRSSAEKRHNQSEVRRQRNRGTRSAVKTANKKFVAAVQEKNREAALKLYAEFEKLIDTAGQKGVYHKNAVARKKSRMHKLLNQLSPSAAQ